MIAPRTLVPLALTALLAPAASAQAVRIVDVPGTGPLASLQAAVDLAPDGALLMLAPGAYGSAIIDGKSLSIVGVEGASPWDDARVNGTLTVRNLAAGQRVLVSNLLVNAIGSSALVLEDDAGHVRVEDCSLNGSLDYGTTYASGAPGVEVTNCQRVVLVDCYIHGGDVGFLSGYPPQPGGDGLRTVDSTVALFECDVIGGTGSQETYPSGGDGGHGANVDNFGLIATGGELRGGSGGGGDYIGCTTGGDGGDGLSIIDAQAFLRDVATLPGNGGWGSCGVNGSSGVPIDATNAVVNQLPGTSRTVEAAALSSDAQTVSVTARGEPGDVFSVFLAHAPAFSYLPQPQGLWAIAPESHAAPLATHLLPAGGELTVELKLADLSGGVLERPVYLQGVFRAAVGGAFLSAPAHLVAIDRDGAPDCDGGGVNDFVDLVEGAPDCNANLILDSCDVGFGLEPDCNGNGIPDSCDIDSDFEDDCNGNDIPDSCDVDSGLDFDCNGNDRLDSCDIALGYSDDVDGDGVPDECQPPGSATIWVDAAAGPGGDGSMAAPFQTIQAGVDAAFHGDRVVVHDGLYTGAQNRDIDPDGREIEIRSVNGPAACVIDCQDLGRGFRVDSGEGPACQIRGFTIRNGNSLPESVQPSLGAGICVMQSSPVIEGCVIEDCMARLGGGVYSTSSSLQVIGCTIQNCGTFLDDSPSTGGGMYVSWTGNLGVPKILDTEISGCSSRFGGGMATGSGKELVISHCRIIDNFAADYGGGISSSIFSSSGERSLLVENTLIAGNSAPLGAGVTMSSTFHAEITGWTFSQCTFANNAATVEGGAVRAFATSGMPDVELHGSVLWGNTAPAGPAVFHGGGALELFVDACDVEGGQTGLLLGGAAVLVWGAGNIDADPLFVDPVGGDGLPETAGDNDYRLGFTSPCADAGDNALVAPDLVDVDGDMDVVEPGPLDLDHLPRFVDDPNAPDTGSGAAPLVDIGAYERQA